MKSNQHCRYPKTCVVAKLTVFLATLLIIFLGNGAFSQAAKGDNTWIKDATVQNVTFYHQIVSCNNEMVLLLKFDNANKKAVTVSWNDVFQLADNYKAARRVAGSASAKKQLSIAPGVTAASGCADEQHKAMVVRSQMVDPTHPVRITDFQFENPVVTGL